MNPSFRFSNAQKNNSPPVTFPRDLPPHQREARFTGTIQRVVAQGGRCLIPVFALGRAQELLLILDEYWQANPSLHGIPIYYASKLASKALRVYQTYVNMMNARIRAAMDLGNPFSFRHISNLRSVEVEEVRGRGGRGANRRRTSIARGQADSSAFIC